MEKKKIALNDVTPEMIEAWKKEYDFVFKYNPKDNKYSGYFRNPSRDEIEAAQAVGSKALTSNAIVAKACFLAGDEELLTRNEYFFGLGKKLTTIMKEIEGEFTEL